MKRHTGNQPSLQPRNGTPVTPMREARLLAHLSQRELSRITGLSRITITHLESSPELGFALSTKRLVAMALNASVQELWPTGNGKGAHRRARSASSGSRDGFKGRA